MADIMRMVLRDTKKGLGGFNVVRHDVPRTENFDGDAVIKIIRVLIIIPFD